MIRKVNKNFFKEWSNEMAYVLGFLAADGYLTHNKRGANYWSIKITDRALLYSIRKIIQSNHKINFREKRGNESAIYRLQIGSKEMCEDLNKLGLTTNKTKSLSVPFVPDEFFSDFVRGYFDGDGHVWVGEIHKERKTRYITINTVFTSCSKKFLVSISDRLKKLIDIKGSIREKKLGCYTLTYSVTSSLKLVNFMYNSINQSDSSLYLKRKKKVFDKYRRP